MSEQLRTSPEEIVHIYNEGIKRHHGRGAFVLNFLRRFPNRPSEIRDVSESEIEIRHQTAENYAKNNLPILKELAKSEMKADGISYNDGLTPNSKIQPENLPK